MRMGPRVVALAALLVTLLTWALLYGSGGGGTYGRALEQAVDGLKLAESHLLKNVLLARAGLLQNYDPLVADARDMRSWSRQIASMPETPPADAREVIERVDREEDLLERFKSQNALLQNSLAYFDLADANIAGSTADPAFKIQVASLASAVTHLLRDPTQENAKSVQTSLDALDARLAASDVAQLRQHGKLLVDTIPATNGLLRAMLENSTATETRRILESIARHRVASEMRRMTGDLTLFACSVLAFLLLVWTFALLRRESDALRFTLTRQRLAFEASSLFIACPPELVNARLSEMLTLLVEGSSIERAYILKLGATERIFLATRRGEPPEGWPRALFAFVPQLLALPADAVSLPYDRVPVSLDLRRALEGAGVRVWSFVKIRIEGEVAALLCFDRRTDVPVVARRNHDNMHLVANVVGNAFLRQRLFTKRSELEAKLRRAERLESIGTFTSGVAHNFNNLIGAIVGQAEMAIDRIASGHEAAEHIRRVLTTSFRAKDVANQILDFGRVAGGTRRDIEVFALVEETVACLPPAATAGIALEVRPWHGRARTCADPAKLQQVFHNVILNAVEASRAGGRVSVSVGQVASPDRTFLHGGIRAGTYVCVTVADEGTGIDKATRERIFQPFFTTRVTGTGLGLATALETVNELDGGIELDSEVGVGTTLTIWLPATHHEPAAATSLAGKTIMVVNGDREGVLRDEDLLATLGFEPIGFTDPIVALDALHGKDDRFDLLIVDEHLVGMSLDAFVRAARKSFADGRRVIATGSGIEAATLEMLDVSGFLARPWRPRLLLSTVGNVLSG